MKTTIYTLPFILVLITKCAFAQQGMGVGNANPQEMLDVSGAIRLGTDFTNSNAAPTGGAGTIRFRAGQFEGWDGSAWIPLGGSGADSDWTVSGNDQYSAVSGNVGIGVAAPSQKLHLAAGNLLVSGTIASVSGIELMPRTSATNAGGRIYFREDNNELFGFSIGYNGGNSGNEILNWPANSFNITRHGNDATGTVVLHINSSESVGIGTTSPTAKLHVEGDVYANGNHTLQNTNTSGTNSPPFRIDGNVDRLYLIAESNANGPTNGTEIRMRTAPNNSSAQDRVTINNQGNVGIGTTTPDVRMQVVGSAIIGAYPQTNTGSYTLVTGTSSSVTASRAFVAGGGHTVAGDYSVVLNNSNSNTAAATTSIVGGFQSSVTANLGLAIGWGNTASGVASDAFGRGNQAHSFGEFVAGTFSENYAPASSGSFNAADRIFCIGNGSSGSLRSNALTVFKNGNVGVGTSSPTEKLTLWNGNFSIRGDQNLIDRGIIISGARQGTNNTAWNHLAQGHAYIRFNNYDSDNSATEYTSAIITSVNAPGSDDGDLRFYTSTDMNPYEAMRIDATGNVGIATAPSERLHVQGSIRMVDGNQQAGRIPVSDANGKMTWTNPSSITTAPDSDWTISGNDQYSAVSGNVGIGTTGPASKVHVSGGDVYIDDATKGVIMKSPNGQCWRMTVDNSGAAVFTSITCP